MSLVAGIFYGIKPAVTAIVLHAAHRIGSRALKNGLAVGYRRRLVRGDLRAQRALPAHRAGGCLVGYGRTLPRPVQLGGGHAAADKSYSPAVIDDDTHHLPMRAFVGLA